MVCIAVSCKSNTSNEVNKSALIASDTTTATPVYPYTIENPDNWLLGSSANSMIVLTSLKKWEEGKIEESIAFFGDSTRLQFDGLDKIMPRDSVKNMLASLWNSYKTFEIKMKDWESVITKDKKEEWVTLWYTEHWETKNGVKDSAAIVNDFQIKDGKIVRLAEYNRKLH